MPAELTVLDAQPTNESVVDMLEILLLRAHAGEISSLGAAWVLRDGRIGSTWSKLPCRGSMMGSIARLQHRVQRQTDDEEDE